MSYGILHHDDQSKNDLVRVKDSSSPPIRRKTGSDHEDADLNFTGREDLGEDFELKDLSRDRRGREHRNSTFDADCEDWESEDEKSQRFCQSRRASASTVQSFMLYTPDEERSVIRKFDRRLVLFVAFLYMLSFLDRSISICVLSWGLIASMQSLAFSFTSLLILRAALGIGEAAFVGVPFFMSFFYRRDELAFRTGLFISAAPLATSFASSLAWTITKIGSHIPIAAWRLLFLVEGFPSIVVSVFVFLYIPDNPESAAYLTRREQRVAKLRLRKEQEVSEKGKGHGLKWKEIRDTLVDPKSYLTAAMFFCINVAFSSLPVFLPTIIEEMGHSAVTSQALSAPPYLIAFFTVLITAYLSDRYRSRSTFVIFHALLAASGYAMMAIAGSLHASPGWRYVGVYPAAMGFFSVVTIIITWTINNQDSDSKKGTGLAMLNYIGQLGPLLGVHLYPDSDQPYYVFGMAICVGFMVAVALLAYSLRRILDIKNQRLAGEQPKDEGEDKGLFGRNRSSRGSKGFVFML